VVILEKGIRINRKKGEWMIRAEGLGRAEGEGGEGEERVEGKV
jgi:hypothetical protein